MKQRERMSIPERLGRLTAKARRWYVHRERGLIARLLSMGVPATVSRVILWSIKVVLFAVMLYVIFWVAVVFLGIVVAIWLAKNVDGSEEPQWGAGSSEDHRQSIFYHPASHNDDPDPRFEDD